MAIFGIGAFYDEDVSQRFISQGVACLGWGVEDSPTLHQILKSIKIGELIYIKKCPPDQNLTIRAIGIVRSNNIEEYPELGFGIQVAWLWISPINIGQVRDRYPIRTNSLYEEFNPAVIQRIIEAISESRRVGS